MQKQLTWYLTVAAAGLFAFIIFFERKLPSSAERSQPPSAFPGLHAGAIETIEISLAGGKIEAQRTNDRWTLTVPLYPAQQTAIENFVTNVARMRKLDRIPTREVALQGAKAFGLETPRATVEVAAGTNHFRFAIGGSTPLTNNIYVRLEPYGEVVVADADILKTLPRSTNDWRSLDAVNLAAIEFDRIQIRLGPRVFEVSRNATNRQWQITKPIPARADQNRIAALLEQLRGAQVAQFVSDAPGADLDRYGLQTPELEVELRKGTNRVYGIEFGAAPTNQTAMVFAELIGHTNVVLLPRALAEYFRQPYKNFHDSRLATFIAAGLDRVTIDSFDKFTLQRQSDGRWATEGKNPMPVDPELFAQFVRNILGIRIIDIAREVPTDADVKALGFVQPIASYSFFDRQTNSAGLLTNILFSDISFGTNQSDRIYARRSDETPIYVVPLAQMLQLPRREFELRDRHIWSFASSNVVRVILQNQSVTNSMARKGNVWSDDAIANAAIEEMVYRLGTLRATAWVAKGESRLHAFAVEKDSPVLKVQLQGGNQPAEIRFGRRTLRHDVYAAIVFPGDTEPTLFEFPGELYQSLMQILPLAKP